MAFIWPEELRHAQIPPNGVGEEERECFSNIRPLPLPTSSTFSHEAPGVTPTPPVLETLKFSVPKLIFKTPDFDLNPQSVLGNVYLTFLSQ